MAATRKPSPTYLDRATVEAMIAEAVAVERERSEKAIASVMLALGGAAQALDMMGDALADAGRALDQHAGLIGPMAEAFAAASSFEHISTEAAPN